MLVLKASIHCIIAVALCLAANFARAESYGSDAPSAGVTSAQAKPKEGKVRFVHKHYVVHPQISTRKRGK